MPAGYTDAPVILGDVDLSSYGGRGSSVAYGRLPAEYVLFEDIVATSEAQAKVVYQQLFAKIPIGLAVTQELAGFSEYKILVDRVGTNPNGYTAFIAYRYLNVAGLITAGGGGLSAEMLTQKALQFAALIPPKFNK
jgi:hypothetical protein